MVADGEGRDEGDGRGRGSRVDDTGGDDMSAASDPRFLPCNTCGEEPVLHRSLLSGVTHAVHTTCACPAPAEGYTYYGTSQKAIDAWNDRVMGAASGV